MERYEKQIFFNEIGEDGQRRLLVSKVVIIGCGALGTVIANNLVRSGVGYVRIVDRDYIELSNLQRQLLFDEDDIKNNLPKAVAAEYKLKKINSEIQIESVVTDVNPKNIEKLCEGMDIILDATDNFQTRFLINDISVKLNIPWIYGGVIGSSGMTYSIIPNKTPCFRCIFPDIPPAGSVDTCDTAGVLNAITNIIASLQSTEAIKILTGQFDAVIKEMRFIDIWVNTFDNLMIYPKDNCTTCKGNNYEFLNCEAEDAVYLCGKDSIQINPMNSEVSMKSINNRLDAMGITIKSNSFYSKFTIEGIQFTLFYDGRAILKNTSDVNKAKTMYSKYIGF